MWRLLQTRLAGLYQYVDVVFNKTPYQNSRPPDNIVQVAQVLFHLLALRQNGAGVAEEEKAWQTAGGLLSDLKDIEKLSNVTNEEGCSPLLVAVLLNDQDVLRFMVSKGCNVNFGRCSLPIHLACRLGNLDIVKLLLESGARTDREAGMCYPLPHVPIRHVPSRFHFLETDIYACDSDHYLPIMYALKADHVDIVRCLLEYNGHPKSNWPYHRYPLHYACQKGAFHCAEYLARIQPSEVNRVDEDGLTPLLHAVVWGKKFVKLLVEAEANVHTVNCKSKGALHVLFEGIKEPLELYETTKFLLGSGLEQDINKADHHGNTALHSLVTLVNRYVSSFGEQDLVFSENNQAYFNEQVVHTAELLLSFNCDPNTVNNSEVTALHKTLLLQDFVVSNDPNGITLEMLPTREMYAINLDTVYEVVRVLLQHRTDANAQTGSGRSALLILLQMVLNMEPKRLGAHCEDFLRCVLLLCQHRAEPSFTLASHISMVTTLAKLGHKCLVITDPSVQAKVSEFICDLLALLLRCGLNSNHCSNRRKPPAVGGSGNILLEMVKLSQYIRQPADLLHIHGWVLASLQWGANPDIEPYPSDPIICHSQSSIFLKPKGTQAVNQYMYEIQDFSRIFEGGFAQKLLMLFYNSMDHEALFQAMNTSKFLSRFDPNRAPSGKFLKLINHLSSQPRTLQQMSRVAIYKTINRKLKIFVPQLPLPLPLKRYLLEVN